MSEERIATFVLLLGQLSAAGGAVIVNILAARVLNPSDRGDLAFGLQIAYFSTVFALMGLERPYMASREGRFSPEYKNFTLLVLPGAVAIIPIIGGVLYLSPLGERWIIVGLVAVIIYTVINVLSRGVRVGYVVSGNWKRFGFHALTSQVLIIVGAVLLTLMEVGSPEAWMGVYALSTLPAMILLADSLRGKNKGEALKKSEAKDIRHQGWVLLPSSFSNTAMTRLDRLLLPVLSTSAALGLYVTVATVLEMASWPIKQWVDASLRKWAKTGEALVGVMNRILFQSFLFITGIAVILSAASYAMIHLILPSSYQAATSAIVPLAIASVIYGLTRVQQGFLIALGAAGRVSLVEIFGTIAAVAAYVALIPPFGMLGAAYGSIIGYLVCLITGAVVLSLIRRNVGLKQSDD